MEPLKYKMPDSIAPFFNGDEKEYNIFLKVIEKLYFKAAMVREVLDTSDERFTESLDVHYSIEPFLKEAGKHRY